MNTDTQEPQGKPNAEQVGRWLEEDHARVSDTIRTPEDIITAWLAYKDECYKSGPNRTQKQPTVGGFALWLGFCSEDGIRFLSQRGPGFARAAQKVRDEIVDGIVQKLLKPGQNAVGAIFYLKNRAGYRDKGREEAADDREDWLTKLTAGHAALAVQSRADAPPQHDPDAQDVAEQDITEQLRLLNSDDSPASASA